MNSGIKLVNSGFPLIDRNWGGIYRGGSYLIVGPKKSGRTLLGLQFAKESALAKETCLYFTTMRPKDLMIQATSLNFDLQTYMNKNRVIVVRVASPDDAYEHSVPDDYLIDYLNDIVTVVNQYKPSRIIFDELTKYVGFRSIGLLRDVFIHTLEVIEENDISSFFVIGEPATPKAEEIVETISESVTGIIQLKKSPTKIMEKYFGGMATISPNVGHAEGVFSDQYIIKPYEGILLADDEEEIIEENVMEKQSVKSKKTHLFDNMNYQNATSSQNSIDDTLFSNIYEMSDFLLVLNNQIALHKSTGQNFILVTLKLDPAAQIKGLLSLKQLQNAVKVSASRKDKICVQENKVHLLLIKSTRENVLEFIGKLLFNLPSTDEGYVQTIKKFISILIVQVNENVANADSLMNYVSSSDSSEMNLYTSLDRLEF